MRFRNTGLFALISGSALLLAGDFWQDKKPSEWTEKDIQRLETKSPWAKDASVVSNYERLAGLGRRGGMGDASGQLGRAGGMGGPGMGGGGWGGGGGGGGWGGGRGDRGESDQGGMPTPKVLVRWDSAAPLRDAAAKGPVTEMAKRVAEWTQDFYVVSVTGLPMMRSMGSGRKGDPQAPNPERIEQMQRRLEQRLKDATKLTIKGRDPIAPARVESISTPEGGRTAIFLFPRTAAISMDDTEVKFETAMGPQEITAKFRLKDMLYHGKLDL